MILISHRGNLKGRDPLLENYPTHILNVLQLGFDVEVDLWCVSGSLKLGHDRPDHRVSLDWLFENRSKLWVHCKNIEALEVVSGAGLNYFWHENDTVTLTNMGFIWAYPGKQPIRNSIAVMPEIYGDDVSMCCGICSDYIINYQ